MSSSSAPIEGDGQEERPLAERHRAAHARRSAETHAAFVLPHLRPGMRLLDCGCGPGSITAGLGRAVAPGCAVGIDVTIGGGRTEPGTGALDAATPPHLCAADIMRLPFADGTFDVVFANALLQHLPEPTGALREMYRVLKPGGLIAAADADYDGSILAPADPVLMESMRLIARLRSERGRGDARVGKRLRGLLVETGFVGVEAAARAGAYGTNAAVRQTGAFWASYFEAPELAVQMVDARLCDRDGLRAISAAWRRWASQPGAFWATFWCEALGRKPAGT